MPGKRTRYLIDILLDIISRIEAIIYKNWGIVQWQDGRFWPCKQGFESLSPSHDGPIV
jgi:hypothetical protein